MSENRVFLLSLLRSVSALKIVKGRYQAHDQVEAVLGALKRLYKRSKSRFGVEDSVIFASPTF